MANSGEWAFRVIRVPSPGPLLRIGTVKAAVEAPAGTRMVPDWAE